MYSSFTSLTQSQQDEVEERVLEAIGNYRTSQDMPGFNEDINDAIDTFQTVVRHHKTIT